MMNGFRLITALGLMLGLGACASMEPASRNSLIEGLDLSVATQDQVALVAQVPRYDVTEIRVDVPRTLRVSEANVFYPIADIVWRGDPIGDRYSQVQSIFAEAFGQGTIGMDSGRKVIVEIEVVRFHALTEKTRYTVGGTHSLKFYLTVRDAETGLVIDGPRRVSADIPASGGARAIAEDQAGHTQRVVIVEHLRQVATQELVAPVLLPMPDAVATSRRENDLILSPLAVTD